MKKTLIQLVSLCLALSLCVGILAPQAQAVTYEGVEPITIDATAALLVDMDTGQVLYEQSADEQRYPASITKVMTALLTLEAISRGELALDTMVTVPAAALTGLTKDSSTANIQAGEQIFVKDLLYCLLLASANEAANILAMTVCGDIPSFVDRMNQRAQELGMEGTHFMNPHGLHDPNHYTTANDIYKMCKQAMTHATFREIVSTSRYNTQATNLSEPRVLLNTNALLSKYKYYGYLYPGTIGIKTGSTGQAGYCLTAAAKKGSRTLCSVVLGAKNPTDNNGNVQRMQFTESKRLLEWGFTNFTSAKLLNANTYLEEIPVRFSAQSSHVVLQPTQSLTALVPGEYDPERLELRLNLKYETASAPIKKGDVLGTVTVIYAGENYGTVDMAAVNDIPFSVFVAFVSSINTIFGNIYVQLLLLLAAVLVVIGILRRRQSRQHEAKKEARRLRQEEKRRQAQLRHERQRQTQHRREVQERKAKERAQERSHRSQEPWRPSADRTHPPTAKDDRRGSGPSRQKWDHRPNRK
ncbi:MAG: serine hydrolase [Evtepia sp.]|uniref:serine hydrolase n=1 Tax=Evtepia sp. TaxID=2773933 RepID=UPI002A74DF23|nr:serine hydrolase [Evtepia sp.]MDY3015097.1 serine hydrolase [Evtepia sp.]